MTATSDPDAQPEYSGKRPRACVTGEWGSMYIRYSEWNVDGYQCDICGYKSSYIGAMQQHIDDDHALREKLEHLSESLGYDDESRIDRFRKVEETINRDAWAANLMSAREYGIEEEDVGPYTGL